jgi:hypothetical protein
MKFWCYFLLNFLLLLRYRLTLSNAESLGTLFGLERTENTTVEPETKVAIILQIVVSRVKGDSQIDILLFFQNKESGLQIPSEGIMTIETLHIKHISNLQQRERVSYLNNEYPHVNSKQLDLWLGVFIEPVSPRLWQKSVSSTYIGIELSHSPFPCNEGFETLNQRTLNFFFLSIDFKERFIV